MKIFQFLTDNLEITVLSITIIAVIIIFFLPIKKKNKWPIAFFTTLAGLLFLVFFKRKSKAMLMQRIEELLKEIEANEARLAELKRISEEDEQKWKESITSLEQKEKDLAEKWQQSIDRISQLEKELQDEKDKLKNMSRRELFEYLKKYL